MDYTTLSNYGVAAIFIFAAYRLYTDGRSDSMKREDKLMNHLDKQADTMEKISDTLQKMDGRIRVLEDKSKED